jgi:DNA-binding CsgD family transcriptional regulator
VSQTEKRWFFLPESAIVWHNLGTEKPMGQYDPKELSPLHQRALRLLSEGLSVRQVAKAVGRSESQISHLKRSAKGQEYLQTLELQQEDFMMKSAFVRSLIAAGYVRL